MKYGLQFWNSSKKKHPKGTSRTSDNSFVASLSANFSEKQPRLDLTAHLHRVSRCALVNIAKYLGATIPENTCERVCRNYPSNVYNFKGCNKSNFISSS